MVKFHTGQFEFGRFDVARTNNVVLTGACVEFEFSFFVRPLRADDVWGDCRIAILGVRQSLVLGNVVIGSRFQIQLDVLARSRMSGHPHGNSTMYSGCRSEFKVDVGHVFSADNQRLGAG